MAYSKAYEKKVRKRAPWPDLRYDPLTGECKLFTCAEDVPEGWIKKKAALFVNKVGPRYDREELEKRLTARGVTINPRWGLAHMKKVLDE